MPLILAVVLIGAILAAFKIDWDNVWREILKGVQEVEKQYQGSIGSGPEKRREVVMAVVAWVKSRTTLSWLQVQILTFVVGQLIDGLVAELNNHLSKGDKNWDQVVDERKDEILSVIPWAK